MSFNPVSSFTFERKDADVSTEAIKWTQNGHRYEIYSPILKSMDVHEIISHCAQVNNKVIATVGDEPDIGPSLYTVFGRSLGLIMQSVWEQVNADADANANINNSHTP